MSIARPTDVELILRAQAGDTGARNALIDRHYGFIWMMTARVSGNKYAGEFIADAIVAFDRCVRRFDPARGCKITTMAGLSIQRDVYKARYRDRLISIPPRAVLAESRGSAVKMRWAERAGDVASMNAPRGNSGASCEFAYSVDGPCTLDEQAEIRHLHECISRLPARDAEVIRSRMREETLYGIGARLGISNERVRQIEIQAIESLREMMAPDQPAPITTRRQHVWKTSEHGQRAKARADQAEKIRPTPIEHEQGPGYRSVNQSLPCLDCGTNVPGRRRRCARCTSIRNQRLAREKYMARRKVVATA